MKHPFISIVRTLYSSVSPAPLAAQLRDQLHALHLSRKCQPYAYRIHYLKQLGYLLQDNAEAICESVRRDLGRNRDEVSFTEVWTSLREVDLAVKRLKGWMKDETAVGDTILAFKGNSTSESESAGRSVIPGAHYPGRPHEQTRESRNNPKESSS